MSRKKIGFVAQSPGWFAAYDDDPDVEDGNVHMMPVCGLVAVEYEETGETEIHHLASAPDGDVRIVDEFPNFIGVVGPGQRLEDVVVFIRRRRAMLRNSQ